MFNQLPRSLKQNNEAHAPHLCWLLYKRPAQPSLPHLVQTLAGFVVLAPQAVGAAKVKQHHGPGRVDGTGVALRGPLPSWGKRAQTQVKRSGQGPGSNPIHCPRAVPNKAQLCPSGWQMKDRRLESKSLGCRPGYLSIYKTSHLQDSIASFSPLSDPAKTWK